MAISRASAAALLASVQRGLSPVELVYVPHERWPLPRSRPAARRDEQQRPGPLQISILDSSFNPPTLAHLALSSAPHTIHGSDVDGDYDAKIYLLSVRNADKTLKQSDASYIQRLEMMLLLAQDSAPHGAPGAGADDPAHHVAIGIIDEPTFVGKARKLHVLIEQRLAGLGVAPPRPRPQLTFLQGFDTLDRLLAPRYYGASRTDPDAEAKMFSALQTFFSPEHDNARVVCARRGPASPADAATLALAERFLAEQRIVLINIGEAEQTYSSTAVRNAIERRAGHSWMKMVSPSVKEYLSKEKLYDPTAVVD